MAITNSFREAMLSGNITGIRIMMKDSLLVDPSFVEFNEMNDLAASISDLYDSHDGRELVGDQSSWDDNYMDKLMVQVVGNFSHERVDHLREVVRKLRPTPPPRPQTDASHSNDSKKHGTQAAAQSQQQSNRRQTTYQEQKSQDERSGRIVKISAGAATGFFLGGAVAAVATAPIITGAAIRVAIASATIVGGAVAGAVLGGAAVAIATRGESQHE